jgi:hypothetical protein
MFNRDDEFDLPPRLFQDAEAEPDIGDDTLPVLRLCPRNLVAPMSLDTTLEGIMQGPHQWESVYRDNRPNSENDGHYTIYRCVFCRQYDSRWESRQFNSPPE